MATPNLTPPVVIAFSGNTGANMCMQAPYAGVDAQITLQPIQWQAPWNNLQLWQFGDDGRIYLYTPDALAQFCVDFPNPAGNGQPILLNTVIPSDQTQLWNLNVSPQSIANVGAGGYFIDNDSGNTGPGNKIEIWAGGGAPGNGNEAWMTLAIPAYYLANVGGAQHAPAHKATVSR